MQAANGHVMRELLELYLLPAQSCKLFFPTNPAMTRDVSHIPASSLLKFWMCCSNGSDWENGTDTFSGVAVVIIEKMLISLKKRQSLISAHMFRGEKNKVSMQNLHGFSEVKTNDANISRQLARKNLSCGRESALQGFQLRA
jgi:hypothetical protein